MNDHALKILIIGVCDLFCALLASMTFLSHQYTKQINTSRNKLINS